MIFPIRSDNEFLLRDVFVLSARLRSQIETLLDVQMNFMLHLSLRTYFWRDVLLANFPLARACARLKSLAVKRSFAKPFLLASVVGGERRSSPWAC